MVLKSIEDYGPHFQSKLIASLLTDKEFLINISDNLNSENFSNDSHKWICEQIIKYYKIYHTTPSLDSLKIEMKKVENDILKLAIKEKLREAYSLAESDDLKYIQQEYSTFILNENIKRALLTSVDMLKVGDYDSIRTLIKNAIKSGEDKNIGHDYNIDIETRYRADARSPIPFPWDAFNKITQGGYGDGDLVLLFGNPKGGKSWGAIAMAAEAIKLGYDIVFYALELGENYVGKRFDACLTGIPVDQLDNHRDEVEKILATIKGKLVIKEYAPKRATLNTIESHLNKLDFKPHAIFIDYLDLLANRKSRSEKKDDIDDVYVDAKGLAKELKIPIVSPSQANRTGADKAILESVHIGGSYEKIMIADIVISLSRNRKDRVEGTGRWHIMGNRYGADGCTFYSKNIDTSMGHFEIDEVPMDDDEIENMHKSAKKEIDKSEKKALKEKFYELGLG
jgi:replicative DNA helicase